jgi:hypothetical protein
MSRIIFSASLAFGLAISGAAFAQTAPSASPACNRTASIASQTPSSSQTTNMAATTSDSGNMGTGASSASIGTGNTDKIGVNNPCVPGTAGQTATGALPGSSSTPQ